MSVVVDEPVPHAGGRRPWHGRVRLTGRFSDLLGRFADDLDELCQCQTKQLVVIEALTGAAL